MSFGPEPADLSEVEDRRKESYVSKKQLVALFVFVPILVLAGFITYNVLKEKAQETICKKNIGEINKALGLYLTDNNDRLPPIYAVNEKGLPMYEGTRVDTWITVVSGYLTRRASFRCPTAEAAECVRSAGSSAGKTELSTYGLYTQWQLQPISAMSDPSTQILVAETSNLGSMSTFDPKPFVDGHTTLPDDGFSIAWDTGNFELERTSHHVTRLAFPKTADGHFKLDGLGRHNPGALGLTGDGHVLWLKPQDARIKRNKEGFAIGLWGDH